MAKFGERSLLGFTTPRSPQLISDYIKIIKKYNLAGKNYNSDLQELFYHVLSSEKVAGVDAGNAKNKALAGRDKLTRMPQALGFLITQNNKKFQVTEAGSLLVNKDLFSDIMLHQILKYQLPSVLHREQETNKGRFNIKPFLELIRLINELNYLTYNEFLTYGMTFIDYHDFEKVVEDILKYRKQRECVKKNGENIRVFDYNNLKVVFERIYIDIIDSGKIKTRESKTDTIEKFVKKKLNNLSDYADSIFRVLLSTGLIINSKGRSLQINPTRKDEVDYLLNNVSREIIPLNIDRDEFDKYISNPRIPILLNDSIDNLLKSIKELGGDTTNIDLDIYSLKSYLNNLREINKKAVISKQVKALKTKDNEVVNDILVMFELITNKEIEPASMRPTFFEWNVWRAMTMINHGKIKGNFLVDDMGNPISTAGGGQSDIIGDYGAFKIGVEVTLSTGNKQYEMESEPVSRHIGELQKKGPAFGIFIAEQLQDSVVNFFYTTSLLNSAIYNGKVDVIPINTKIFIEFFKRAVCKDIKPNDLYKIHEYSLTKAKEIFSDEKTERDWHNSVIEFMLNTVS